MNYAIQEEMLIAPMNQNWLNPKYSASLLALHSRLAKIIAGHIQAATAEATFQSTKKYAALVIRNGVGPNPILSPIIGFSWLS